MEPATIASLIANFGFPIAMVIWLIINNKQKAKQELLREEARREEALKREERLADEALARERRLGERIDQVEDARNSEMVGLIQTMAASAASNAEALKENNAMVKKLCRNFDKVISCLEKRPCLGVDEPGPPGNLLGHALPRATDRTGETTEASRKSPR